MFFESLVDDYINGDTNRYLTLKTKLFGRRFYEVLLLEIILEATGL
ncbi:MAG: hypothetical protein HRU19_12380 [Pseudobacteriovorax sp.]|nr:hypothetical protein [Pseudobacteriovorax sp.]